MYKADTIQQFKCLEWAKEQFVIEEFKVEAFSKNALKITDKNGESAVIKWSAVNGVQIQTEIFILADLKNELIVYEQSQLNEVVDANGYIAPIPIGEYASMEDALNELRRIQTEQESHIEMDYIQ